MRSCLLKKYKDKSNKHDQFERKHNYAIYFYLVGVCMSDLIVLISWLINKLTISTQLDTQIVFETAYTTKQQNNNNINNEKQNNSSSNNNNNNKPIKIDTHSISLSYIEFMEFRNNFSVSNGLNVNNSFDSQNEISNYQSNIRDNRPGADQFLSVNYFINDLNSLLANDIQYISTKLTNIQGICQVCIYSYFLGLYSKFVWITEVLLTVQSRTMK